MERRILHLTLISAKGLKNHRSIFFGKNSDTYAVVSTINGSNNRLRESYNAVFTPMASVHSKENACTDPQWNYPMDFEVEEGVLQRNESTLVIQIKGVRMFGCNKLLGIVNVPVKELLERETADVGSMMQQVVSYELEKASGKLYGGVVTFRYYFGEKFKRPVVVPTKSVSVPRYEPAPVRKVIRKESDDSDSDDEFMLALIAAII
ncbi:protein SRC2-like [Rutidosis leptorrhynchoides]|uniref:protein SRC2-like n=1 Tax=Rutidosis leptorrhynchoides TaxID=125765 RepID=UPI003A98EA35